MQVQSYSTIHINNSNEADNFLEFAFEISSINCKGNPSNTSLYIQLIRHEALQTSKVSKGHPCTGTEALYRPYDP